MDKNDNTLLDNSEYDRLTQYSRLIEEANLAYTETEVYEIAARYTANILKVHRCSIALLDDSDQFFDVIALNGSEGIIPVGQKLPRAGTMIGDVLDKGEVIVVHDASDSDYLDVAKLRDLGSSFMNAPLISGGKIHGTLNTMRVEAHSYVEADKEVIRQVAGLLASNIESRRLFEYLQKNLEKKRKYAERLQRSQALLKTSHEIAQIGSWEWDAVTNALTFSEQMFKITGLDSDSFNGDIDKNWGALAGDKGQELAEAIEFGFQEEMLAPYEYSIAQTNGSQRIVWAVAQPFYDENNDLVRVVGTAQDITERKQLESQLVQSQKLESIGQLAAGVAHEINTPIQYVGDNVTFLQDSFSEIQDLIGIYGAVIETAKAGKLDEDSILETESELEDAEVDYLLTEIPKALEQTLEGIERVASIVRAMKEFSHPGQEEKVMMDVNGMLKTTTTIARNEWKYVALVEFNLDPSLPEVPCMPSELNQVFLNVLVNAAHAIEKVVDIDRGEKGTITLSTSADEKWVEIRISDTGCGIPEHARHRIFDPFYTTKEVGKGTGQGLAISQSVVTKKHNGQLFFETETGKGTTFFIRLPREVE